MFINKKNFNFIYYAAYFISTSSLYLVCQFICFILKLMITKKMAAFNSESIFYKNALRSEIEAEWTSFEGQAIRQEVKKLIVFIIFTFYIYIERVKMTTILNI